MKLIPLDIARDTFARLKPHVIAELMPPMESEEWQSLLASVRAGGLLQPVVVYEHCILDGRHRHRAYVECVRQGLAVAPSALEFDGTFAEALEYSVAANVVRRHLTPSQRAVIAAQVALLKPGEHADDGQVTQPRAASMLHVSPRLVRQAAEVAKKSPGMAREVREGKLTLSSARRRLEPPPPPQTPLLADGCAIFERLETVAKSLLKELRVACHGPWGQLLDEAMITAYMRTVIAALEAARPASPCPRLDDGHDENCPACDGRGWMPAGRGAR